MYEVIYRRKKDGTGRPHHFQVSATTQARTFREGGPPLNTFVPQEAYKLLGTNILFLFYKAIAVAHRDFTVFGQQSTSR